MPSFDIVSKIDPQNLDNAINVLRKEIQNRFDFKDSPVIIDLDKKEMKLELEAASDMKIKQITDALISRAVKQGINPLAFDMNKDAYPSGKVVRKQVLVRNGLKQEDAKKIVKMIKDSGVKVQAAIMDDLIRVTGKKLDDLQEVMAKCKAANFEVALQFDNMRS